MQTKTRAPFKWGKMQTMRQWEPEGKNQPNRTEESNLENQQPRSPIDEIKVENHGCEIDSSIPLSLIR